VTILDNKTNKGLVEYVKKALNEKWGYVWGTFGQILTETLFNQKLSQYPEQVGAFKNFIITNWMGRKVTDCVGLIKSYMWFDEDNNKVIYNSKTDVNANMMYSNAKEKGTINTIPEIIGLCLYKQGHIGVYIGNGQVIEARGTKYGVIQTPLKGVGSTPWTHWLKCPYIEYIKEESKPLILKLGSKGIEVKQLQKNLITLGYDLGKWGADSDFGNATFLAVKKLQEKYGLKPVDGIVGKDTYALIDRLLKEKDKVVETPKVESPVVNDFANYPILKNGSKGEYVLTLQKKLQELGYILIADGIFRSGTEKIVKEFQRDYGLVQDGVVGKNSWSVLMTAKKIEKNYTIEYMNGYINIVKIPKDKLKKIDVILCKQPTETLKSVYNRLNPKPSFLLNGGLFAMNNGNSMSSMWDEGKKIVDGYFSDYGLYVKNDGSFGFGNHKQLTNIRDFMGASPTLIVDGKINIDLKGLTTDKNFTNYRHPRTCIGMDDKYLYLIVVDGRQTGKLGMTINELANFGMNLGLKYFINLDGGGSSRLLDKNGDVINSPTENRAVDNCLAIYL
jgi:peptidoglycan hydrolase-like protein with peptidoglycan-binding domain